jgi:hypothetical protein
MGVKAIHSPTAAPTHVVEIHIGVTMVVVQDLSYGDAHNDDDGVATFSIGCNSSSCPARAPPCRELLDVHD